MWWFLTIALLVCQNLRWWITKPQLPGLPRNARLRKQWENGQCGRGIPKFPTPAGSIKECCLEEPFCKPAVTKKACISYLKNTFFVEQQNACFWKSLNLCYTHLLRNPLPSLKPNSKFTPENQSFKNNSFPGLGAIWAQFWRGKLAVSLSGPLGHHGPGSSS